ncbi:hypothetical protein Tco_1515528 [Tanacetum coccineum]
MSTYLKNMAGYKHSQLKSKNYDEIQKLFDKEMKRENTFVDMELVKYGEITRVISDYLEAGWITVGVALFNAACAQLQLLEGLMLSEMRSKTYQRRDKGVSINGFVDILVSDFAADSAVNFAFKMKGDNLIM